MGSNGYPEDAEQRRQTFLAWRRLSWAERGSGALLAAAMALVILLARWLEPDPSGVGTHEQLGLAPCTFHWVLGLPCPFCGMTTAFSHLAHGNVATGFASQPAGALFFFGVLAVMVGGAACAVSGLFPARAVERLTAAKGLFLLAAIVGAAWIYTIIRTLAHGS